jgi:hypothetical protein
MLCIVSVIPVTKPFFIMISRLLFLLSACLLEAAGDTIVDGEIVALNETGRPPSTFSWSTGFFIAGMEELERRTRCVTSSAVLPCTTGGL